MMTHPFQDPSSAPLLLPSTCVRLPSLNAEVLFAPKVFNPFLGGYRDPFFKSDRIRIRISLFKIKVDVEFEVHSLELEEKRLVNS